VSDVIPFENDRGLLDIWNAVDAAGSF